MKEIRHATLEDIPDIIAFGKELIEGSSYEILQMDPAKARQTLEKFIVEAGTTYLCLVVEDEEAGVVGAIAGHAFTPLFSSTKTAAEVFWYLSPAHRKGRRGKDMMEAYEYWAKLSGCSTVHYGLLQTAQEGLGRLYERGGAVKTETVYVKDLKGVS